MIDLYPTRVSAEQGFIARCDSTVCGPPGAFTTEQRFNYKENGFIVLKDFFLTETIQDAREQAELLFNYAPDSAIQEPNKKVIRSILDIYDQFKNYIRTPGLLDSYRKYSATLGIFIKVELIIKQDLNLPVGIGIQILKLGTHRTVCLA